MFKPIDHLLDHLQLNAFVQLIYERHCCCLYNYYAMTKKNIERYGKLTILSNPSVHNCAWKTLLWNTNDQIDVAFTHASKKNKKGRPESKEAAKDRCIWTLVQTLFIILSIHKTNGLSFIRECFEFTLFLVPFFRCHLQHSLRDKSP